MTFLDQFLNMMTTQRRATRSTLSAYEADLRSFSEFFKGQKIEDATPLDLEDYLETQHQLSSATVARRLSSLRQFYAYLWGQKTITTNPCSLIKGPPVKALPSSPLDQADIDRLWEGIKSWRDPEGKRLAVLLHLLQSTDRSAKEIVALPFEFHLNTPTTPLQDYLNVRPYFLSPGQESPWLFPSSSQKGHLTPQRFGQLLKELGIKMGIDATLISFSTFRRGFPR